MPVFFYAPSFAFEHPGLAPIPAQHQAQRATADFMGACKQDPTHTLPTRSCHSQRATAAQAKRRGAAAASAAQSSALPFQTLSASGAAAFDLVEGPDAFTLFTNAPGLSHDDISIDLDDWRVLSISGKKPAPQQLQQEEQKQWELLSEGGSLSCPSPVEGGVDEDGRVEAADDEEDERVRHPGQHSPVKPAPSASPAASAGAGARASYSGAAAAAAAPAITSTTRTADDVVRVLFSERGDPAFKRMFKLPDYVLVEDISASLERGVLTVRVPKKPAQPIAQPRRIAVKLVA